MTEEEEIAEEVATRLLDRIPPDAFGWVKRIGCSIRTHEARKVLCCAHVNKNSNYSQPYYCTRPKGHLGDHVALGAGDNFLCRCRNKHD